MNPANFSNQLQLFKSLFKGREDVFAIRWEKGNKSGYMPAYFFDPYMFRKHKIGGGTFQNYSDKKYLPLSDLEIEKHFNGEQHIGIYPLLQDNTSYFIAADFDKENWCEECKLLIAACSTNGIPAYLERSRSGKGGHVWIFFEQPYPAYWRNDLYPTQTDKEAAFQDLLNIMAIMQNLKCTYTCITYCDAEFNPTSQYDASGWTQQSQINNADFLIDRPTIPSYVAPANWDNTFDWKCHVYNKFREYNSAHHSKLFLQLSSESTSFTNCQNTGNFADFLGDYLNGVSSPSGNMYSVEFEFIKKLDDPSYVCPNCNCLTFDANHYSAAVHPHENIIMGSMWFTYSIMNQHNLFRKSNGGGELLADDIIVKSEPGGIRIEMKDGNNVKRLFLFDLLGKLLDHSDSNILKYSATNSGIKILRIEIQKGNVPYRKLFVQNSN